MTVGVLYLDLAIPQANSLKDKRRVVKSLKDRIHNRFNCSVAELGRLESWRSSLIAVCIIGDDVRHVNSQLSSVVSYVGMDHQALLADYRIEML